MKLFSNRHTVETGIMLGHFAPKHWQYVDCNENRKAQVGPVYHTKAEALSDLESYIYRAGWLVDNTTQSA